MMIAQLNTAKTPAAPAAIELNYYVGRYYVSTGWYALGHHDPDEFFAAAIKHDPISLMFVQGVRLVWAKFRGRKFEIFDQPVRGAQPITTIEILD